MAVATKNETIQFARAVKEDMGAYAAEVNFNRAIVDISGLKRVQLRILYTMYKMKLYPNKPRAKCPDIVGNVIQLHPHADTAIYDALVRLAQPWTLNYPLIDFKGNSGSEDNDSAAASRYTEARLSPYGYALIAGIENTSPFEPDYADHGMEPRFLAPAFPSLFVNISKGIGVAAACNFLPHSLTDICRVIKQRMAGVPEDEILSQLWPSFPTGGVLVNGSDLPNIYKTGRGSVKLRAKYTIKGSSIIFTELPYQVSRTDIIDLITDRKDSRIVDIDDTSTMDQKSITITVRPTVNKEAFIKELFKNTRLEDNFAVNMTVHNRKEVLRKPFLALIDEYLLQQHERIVRIAEAAQADAEKKKHELEGLAIILPSIDRAIEIIKTSSDNNIARERLMGEFVISIEQANAILKLRLSQLTKKGIEEIDSEIFSLTEVIEKQQAIKTDKSLREEMLLEDFSVLPEIKMPKMSVEMGSIPQTSEGLERVVTTTSGEEVTLGDNDEILVVTAERRAYRFKGKQLDKMPKDEVVLLETPKWFEQQKTLNLFGVDFIPGVISCQCKSTRGAKLKI